jgi:hypothetical protein
MAIPELVYNFPSNEDENIPVGERILLAFSNLIDHQTARDSIILVGKVRDRVVGASISTIAIPVLGDSKYFMKSPGFSGTVPLKFTFERYLVGDTTYTPVSDAVADRTVESSGPYASLVSITPEGGAFAPEIVYTLYINGDTEATGHVGVSSKTAFDIVPNPANSSTEGTVHIGGTWFGEGSDTINIKITSDGNPGSAKYKWWFSSLGEGSAKSGNVTSRRYRSLDDKLQVRFGGSSFVTGDRFTLAVYGRERMDVSHSILFSTNDGTWTAAPTLPSAPASSLPGSLIASETTYLEVVGMDPEHASYNVRNSLRTVRIAFSEDIDPDTLTEENLKIWKTSVDGHYQNTYEPKNLRYEYEVDGNTLILKF